MKKILYYLLFIFLFENLANSQEFVWTNSLFGSDNVKGSNDIIVDNLGNSYITGSFEETLQVENKSIISKGLEDIFVAKFNSKGKLVWIIREGDKNMERGSHLCLDNKGNLYVIGEFEGNTTLGNMVFSESGNIYSTFVLKYDTTGNFRSTYVIPGRYEGSNFMEAVMTNAACDSVGNLLLSGRFGKYFDSQQILPIGNSGVPTLALIDTLGNAIWAVNAGGNISPKDIAIDHENNCYLTGHLGYYDYTTSGQKVSIGDSIMTITDGADIFLVKISNSGQVLWTKTLSQGIFDTGEAIYINKNSELFLSGSITTPTDSIQYIRFFISKFDLKGNVKWLKQSTGSGVPFSSDVIADNDGNSFIYGTYYGSIYFDSLIINCPTGENHIFVVKFDNEGNAKWITNIKDNSNSYFFGSGIGIDPINNLYITGGYRSLIAFGNSVLYNPIGYNLFISALIDSTLKKGSNVVKGKVFDDINNNCTFDFNDTLLFKYSILAEPGPIYCVTDRYGKYSLYLDSGSYNISILPPFTHLYSSSINCSLFSNYNVDFTDTNEVMTDIDFANHIIPHTLYKVEIQSDLYGVDCYDHNMLFLKATNLGLTDIDSLQLVVKYPDENFEFLKLMPDSINKKWIDNSLYISKINLKKDSVFTITIVDSVSCNGDHYDPYFPYDFLLSSLPKNTSFAQDSLYNKDQTSIFIGDIISINEKKNQTLKIYPNPSSGFIIIDAQSLENDFIINIFTINGILKNSFNMTSSSKLTEIDLSNLENGLYILELKNNNAIYINKLLILK